MQLLLALVLVAAQAQGQPADPVRVSPQTPSAAAEYVGRPIVQAEVFVDGRRSTDPTLLELVETSPGSRLSMATVRETIAHLYSLGRYQEVSVDATAVGDGVRLRFDLAPIQNVEEIDFRGTLGLSRGQLRSVVTDRFGAAPPASRAGPAAELLQRHYFERGFLDAAIRPILERRGDSGRTVLTFEVNSGPRARIRNVAVKGDPGLPRDAFLREIHAEPGRIYQLVEVQRRLSDYVARLRRNGRYEASASHRMESRSDDGESVDLSITIEPGPEVVVRFEGDPLPKDRLEELVPVRREGSVDIDIIEDSEQRIIGYLNQQGYWRASVTSTRHRQDGRLEVVFTVRRGPQYRIEGGVEVSGNASVPLADLRPALEALGANDLFLAVNLDAAVAAIRRIYLQRGFAQVQVESAANELPATASGQARVKPVIVITEGPLMRVGSVTFAGNDLVPAEELRSRLRIATGQPYYEPQVVADREAVLREYLNRGFPDATVVAVPVVAADEAHVDVRFEIVEGTQTFIDHVLIVGNVRTRADVIRRELDRLQPGQPLGLEALFDARRRLSELGLFRRVRITQIVHGESGRRDLLVEVEEAPSTTIGYGGGLELNNRLDTGETGEADERLELAPRGFFEVGRRNIGGRNRSANLYTRLSLRSDNDPETRGVKTFGFPEYRVVATYREPRTFGWNADVTVTGAVEQGVRAAYKFARKGVNAEMMRRLSPQIRGTARYTFGTTRTFDLDVDEEEQVTIDRLFPQVRLSAFSASVARDTRDDLLEPSRGFFLSGEASLAARSLGGQVGFLKSYLQGHAYRRVPIGRRIIFASRLALGLADGFPREVVVTAPDGTTRVQIVEDLPASERFFAGGDTTIRGFALDSVGTTRTITSRGLPLGGNALVLANAELRVPVWKDVGAALFVDAGNVFERVSHVDLGELRGSVGVGLRYRSPFGPLRFDVGFKLDRRGNERPRSFHFSFGQAF
ncbi:MAG TPA: POTRA domain-containing protein [Vicinamibacterales bacterium]|nr:POTRA domain-containing protein [Vicinamibacterales bacterium]